MQRVEREKRSDQSAAPRSLRHAAKSDKEKRGVRRVQQDVNQMMPAGPEPKDLAIDHVRDPGEGMPVAGRKRCERPNYIAPG